MPFLNFENRHFTAAEKTAVETLLNQLETTCANKMAKMCNTKSLK